MNNFTAPNPRYRIYTSFNSYSSFLFDLILGRLNKGNEATELEKILAKKVGVVGAVCIPMARVGVYLTIKHLIKPGQEVIMSPYTIADIVNMVVCAGGVPVFADIEQKSCNINPRQIEQLISDRTGAVLITHLHGVGAPTAEISKICQKYNLSLIEDTAQAFGAKENGKYLGTIGQAGIYSFGMYKNINGWYGGVVVSNDQQLIDKIRTELNQYNYPSVGFILKRIFKGLTIDILTHPFIFKFLTYWVFRYGFLNNITWINRKVEIELDTSHQDTLPEHYLKRFTPWQARLILSQLNQIDSDSNNRFQKAEIYYQGLKDITNLVLPPISQDSTYMYFPIQYQDRKKLLKWLMFHKRDVAAQHLKNCADLPGFVDFYHDCPVARKTAEEVIILPTYPRYPISEARKNIKVIQDFFVNQQQ